MKIKATFIGKSGSLGYIKNKVYELTIRSIFNSSIIRISRGDLEGLCEYQSLEKFLENWKNISKI